MKARLVVLILGLILSMITGCNGEKERPKEVEKIILRQANYQVPEREVEKIKEEKTVHEKDIFDTEKIKNVDEKRKFGDGFVLSGSGDLNSFGDKESCIVMIYSKELKNEYLYVYEDCHGNKTQQVVRK